MKSKIFNKIKNFLHNTKLIRYGIIGIITQLIDFVTYAIFVHLGLNYIVADFVNNPISLSFNYIGHKYFTFQKMPWENKELGRYILNLIFNYIYTTAILVLFVDILNLDEIIAKIAQIIAVALINFFILKKFVFIT